MKSQIKNVLIPCVSAVFGGLIVVLYLSGAPNLKDKLSGNKTRSMPSPFYPKAEAESDPFAGMLSEDLLAANDPFEHMLRLQEQMRQARRIHDQMPFGGLGGLKMSSSGTSVSKREDQGYVYFDISVTDLKSTQVDTRVEGNYLTITSKTKKDLEAGNDDAKGSRETFVSASHQRIALPPSIDPKTVQVLSEENKIVVKFAKLAHQNSGFPREISKGQSADI